MADPSPKPNPISKRNSLLAPQFFFTIIAPPRRPFMDFITGDDFPDDVAPFPQTADLPFTHPTPIVRSLESFPLHQNPTPQKLRPIRGSGRSPRSSLLAEAPEMCQNLGSPEVGFLGNQIYAVNGESSRDFESLEKEGEAAKSLQREDASVGAPENVCVESEDPIGTGSGTAVKIWNPNDVGGLLEEDSSLSSYSSDDLSTNTKQPVRRKKRKRSRVRLEEFLENLVKKVMEKQEEMHKQMIEMIEVKERERRVIEEAWKQQEMERIKREKEVRDQEKYRNLALISYMQSILGHEIQIPGQVVSRSIEENFSEAHFQRDLKNDPGNNRWPDAEVQVLITLRTALEQKFRKVGSKVSIWEEISEAMTNMGYNRNAKKCKEKWENINKYYKRTIGSGKRCLNGKTCHYLDELDILYRNGLLTPGNAFSSNSDSVKIDE